MNDFNQQEKSPLPGSQLDQQGQSSWYVLYWKWSIITANRSSHSMWLHSPTFIFWGSHKCHVRIFLTPPDSSCRLDSGPSRPSLKSLCNPLHKTVASIQDFFISYLECNIYAHWQPFITSVYQIKQLRIQIQEQVIMLHYTMLQFFHLTDLTFISVCIIQYPMGPSVIWSTYKMTPSISQALTLELKSI